jgi:FKBP-type peptidyl-prolyl cis-trans isomerase FkpA
MKISTLAAACVLMSLAINAGAADAKEEKTASGIAITTMKEGSGASPKSADVVKVHYRGTLTDGKEFDSSYKRGQPATFPLNRVIPCWTEGVQTMKVGGKAKLVCPSNLAYGSRGIPGTIPPDAVLTFEIELLEIVK